MKFNQSDNTLLPTLAVTVGAAIWGIYWLPLRYIDQLGMSGVWAVVLASLIPLFILIPLLIWYRSEVVPDYKTILVIGFFTGGALAFYSIGLIYTTVVRATLFFYLTPVWSTLIGIVVLREQVHWNRWAAIVIGLVGLYLIVGGGATQNLAVNIGDWFGLASGLFWGIGAVMIKQNPKLSVKGLVTSQHLFSLLFALICCILLPQIVAIPELAIWFQAAPAILIYSWFGLVPGLFVIFWASGKLFPGRVGILMMTEVLVAVISAAILLDEPVMPLEWLGVVLIVSAGFLEVIGDNQPAEQVA